MDREIHDKHITTMQHHLDAADKYLGELAKGYRSTEKCNTLLDAAMQQIELCCIDMRNLCERIRPKWPKYKFGYACYNQKEIYGEVTLMDNGWLDIRLNALLPHCKVVGGTQYVCDSITRLLDSFAASGGKIPFFEKAYMAIVEHCNTSTAETFDNDNKGFRGVVNALKGRLFKDDNQFELALGLFTVIDDDTCCHIYIMPFEDAGDFVYQMDANML